MEITEHIGQNMQQYPLLPYSQLVWDMMQVEPDIYNFIFTLRVPKTAADIASIKNAFTLSLSNHPVFSMRVDGKGMQSYRPFDDILNGQFHSVRFEDKKDYTDIHICGNRILGDNVSGRILMEDICRAYQGLELEKDYYLDYLEWVEEYKKSDIYEKHRQWFDREFSTPCPVHPQTDLPLSSHIRAIEGIKIEDFSAYREKIQAVSEKYIVSVSALFSLAAAMAIMQYNGTDKAALTWAYEGREKPMEQRIFGSMHRDIPLKIEAQTNKEGLFRQIRTQMRQGIAHNLYPYTLIKPNTERWNYAVNVLAMPSNKEILDMMPFEAEVIVPDSEHLAYSLLDIEIYDGQQLTLLYRYSATHYKEQSIERFAGLVRKNIEWLCD
ncbi:MAG: hypothetical protein IJ834_07105 [Paludibacteraceae bacterium]|nr:hypothetical protein [Paludibacteraceae bacterium]